ncbi:partial Serine/threonine-protein kinase Pkn1, partial [Gammaproteobacteria bacterium]
MADVLKMTDNMAVIGDAGAGKTTLLHVLTIALSIDAPEKVLPADLLEALPQPRLLPVLLPLRQFELACGRGLYARTESDLLRFVDEWFLQWCDCVDLPAGFLAAHIRSGRAWLLLDALDEVADPDHRVTIRNVIQTLARDYPQTRVIVTARVAGYKGAALNDQFTVVQVRNLDDEQRAQMIRLLYANLALSDPSRQADELIGRFTRSDSLRDLGRTPVMVWTAAIIHALRGELPEGRAALYDAYVDILLKHSYARSAFEVEAVKAFSDSQRWPLTDRRHYLSYAAFEVHRLLEDQPDRHGDKSIVIGEDELADRILAQYFRASLGDDARAARSRAREFVGVMVAHSGLLYETSQGYTIGDHLTMQEFLAGCYLSEDFRDDSAYARFLADKVGTSWWREVFTLAAGYLATRPSSAARNFLRQIAAQGEVHSPQRLCGLTLAARGLVQLRVQRPRPNWYEGLARDFAQALYVDLYGSPVDAPVAVRHEAGLMLGLLGGDPRFAYPQSLPEFKRIEAGWFWMGSTDEEVDALIKSTSEYNYLREKPHHRIYVDAFELARFPTTNAMYARFIAAGGYANSSWWGEAIEAGCWKDGKVQNWVDDQWYDRPHYWDDLRFNNPAQPVVGVNWYEAVAYCRWLTSALNDGCTYRLPTEAEWEKAVRALPPVNNGGGAGVEVRAYPWGNNWQADACNSKQANLDVTSTVGVFYKGVTPTGLEDMVGNVFEWCADWY